MIKIDATTGLVISHTPAPRKRMFEDLETAAKAMKERDERTESISGKVSMPSGTRPTCWKKSLLRHCVRPRMRPRANPCVTLTWTEAGRREQDHQTGDSCISRRVAACSGCGSDG